MLKNYIDVLPSIIHMSDDMLEKLEAWQTKHNIPGGLTFSFTPGNIITNVKVYHHDTMRELDLTDYENM